MVSDIPSWCVEGQPEIIRDGYDTILSKEVYFCSSWVQIVKFFTYTVNTLFDELAGNLIVDVMGGTRTFLPVWLLSTESSCNSSGYSTEILQCGFQKYHQLWLIYTIDEAKMFLLIFLSLMKLRSLRTPTDDESEYAGWLLEWSTG